ncbi:MAG: B12-binding domain-containing radical SAM protein [Sandaracinaceae bacterium]|nr:B12-binding domain-containing radical SAM protein [Sandaracinaceae bacterium]
MKIQLIHGPTYLNPGALSSLGPAAPIGLAYVAAALRQEGHSVGVIDAIAEAPEQRTRAGRLDRLGLTDQEVVDRIDPDTDAIGITSMFSFQWPLLREMAGAIRRARPDVAIVGGGEHLTALPERSMRESALDFIVLGEGEETAVALFGALEKDRAFDRRRLPGICWRAADGTIVSNPRAARRRDLDAIAWPAWDLFDLEVYDEHHYTTGNQYGKTVPILATRGCPYQCTFCSSPNMWTPRWFARDPKDVVDEIAFYVKTYGADHFPFQDLTAVIRKRWIVEFCTELIARDLDVRWQLAAGTRCEAIDEEVVGLLYRSGCRALYFAPESGSEVARKRIKKKLDTSALMRAAELAIGAGLNLGAYLVIGFPEDTAEELEETVALAKELGRLGLSDVACALFFPVPATPIWDDLVASGRIQVDDAHLMAPIFSHGKYQTEEFNFCKNVSARRLTWYKYKITAAFYSSLYRHHPDRIGKTVGYLLSGEEDSKLEALLLQRWRHLTRHPAVARVVPRAWSGPVRPTGRRVPAAAQRRRSSTVPAL